MPKGVLRSINRGVARSVTPSPENLPTEPRSQVCSSRDALAINTPTKTTAHTNYSYPCTRQRWSSFHESERVQATGSPLPLTCVRITGLPAAVFPATLPIVEEDVFADGKIKFAGPAKDKLSDKSTRDYRCHVTTGGRLGDEQR